jgi:alkylation response protein AidB-like acyl-CoA dehydrogenase
MRKAAEHEAELNLPGLDSWARRQGRVDLLIEQVRRAGAQSDPVIRQELVRILAMHQVSAWTEARAIAAQDSGRVPGPEGSIGKLAASHVARAASSLHARLLGAYAILAGEDAPMSGLVTDIVLSVPAVSIAGGTDEIQKNILAERFLGMPRDGFHDRNAPFRDIPRNT